MAAGENSAYDFCADLINRRPEGSCSVKACKKAMQCDWQCAEVPENQSSTRKYERCRAACWDKAETEMRQCG